MKQSILIKNIYNKYLEVSIYIYYLALILIPIGLLFSRAMLSIGYIALFANWFLEGEYEQKWKLFKQHKDKMLISIIFLIHMIGMLNTENIEYGFLDLKIKLPLLLPLFFGSSPKLLNIIKSSVFTYLFAVSTLVATLVGFIKFEYILKYQTIDDIKNITFMGQNIMLSLFVNFSIFIFLSYIYQNWFKSRIIFRIGLLVCLLWLIVFLYLLNSLTGYITFIFLILYSLIYIIVKLKKKTITISIFIIVGLSVFTFSTYVNRIVHGFYEKETINFDNLDKKTANGRPYLHNTERKRTENSHYIDVYICMDELEKEWGNVSSLNIYGEDKKGQVLSETLIRYLSSKGLRKDSAGLNQLKPFEIAYIENGCANYKYINKYSLESRIYIIIWQLNTYIQTGNASAQSISQRIDYLKSAKHIIKENFWFGVGTGDVKDVFDETLTKLSPELASKNRYRVHNQYIVVFTALGIISFIVFMIALFYPIFHQKIWNNYIFTIFYLIILLAFFTDNPMETQLGVGFFAYFYCLNAFNNHHSKSL